MRPRTTLQTWNLALGEIGNDPVPAIDSVLNRALICDQWWDVSIDELIRAHDWNWAMSRAELTADPLDAPDFGYKHAYELPAGFATAVSVEELDEFREGSNFELENGFLLCSEGPTIALRYVAVPDLTDNSAVEAMLSRMDAEAYHALVLMLASKIAPRLAKDGRQMKREMLGEFERIVSAARTKSANERRMARKDGAQTSRMDHSRHISTAG